MALTVVLLVPPENGPASPLRLGPADNVYMVPVPTELSTKTTTLIAAGCCLPPVLLLVSTLLEILDDSRWIYDDYKPVLKSGGDLFILPVSTALMLAVLVKGEMNFWSLQTKYQTEAMQSVGQWAPVVGTAIAILGAVLDRGLVPPKI
ncbi:hypothetical protein N7447_000122 [Penicillium robsamsonii]|uniref:uncharacterized protein n=1 Tax=Penicillium robsamsonii TaxID=1792511 RepID=UPI0025477B60|nr:uncharacterized protein N7447_000122 [Penicillium robsamsonii]KAJ5834096.1 hypothetical protein N7447_000122 [Penicillium robsamsonii]